MLKYYVKAYQEIKKSIYECISFSKQNPNSKYYNISLKIDYLIYFFVFFSVIVITLQTVQPLYLANKGWFEYHDSILLRIFFVEYLIRLWSCTADYKYRELLVGRIMYILRPIMILDLIAFLPLFFQLPPVFMFFRIFRLTRVYHLLNSEKYDKVINKLLYVVKDRFRYVLVTFAIMALTIIIFATIMYLIENPYQPNIFSDIPSSIWFVSVSIFTIGYGDMIPITPIGKFMALISSMLGIVLMAIITGIITSGFIQMTSDSGLQD